MQFLTSKKENIKAIFLNLYTLIHSVGLKCSCGKTLVAKGSKYTVIKQKLFKIYDEEGTIDIICSKCGKVHSFKHK